MCDCHENQVYLLSLIHPEKLLKEIKITTWVTIFLIMKKKLEITFKSPH